VCVTIASTCWTKAGVASHVDVAVAACPTSSVTHGQRGRREERSVVPEDVRPGTRTAVVDGRAGESCPVFGSSAFDGRTRGRAAPSSEAATGLSAKPHSGKRPRSGADPLDRERGGAAAGPRTQANVMRCAPSPRIDVRKLLDAG
jgi:hypothetical protein